MKNLKFKIFTFYIVILIFTFLSFNFAGAVVPDELKNAINQKADELQNITGQIKEGQKSLEEAQGQSRTLQKEIGKIDTNINQILLSVKASEITIEKFELEIDSFNYAIGDAEKKIIVKEEAIAEILKKLQQKDDETPLIIFLKNKSLAQSVFEAQALADLNNGLTVEISALKLFKEELANSIKDKSDKKGEVEWENRNLKNQKVILADVKNGREQILKETKNREQTYQKLIDELSQRQSEIAAEIELLEEELRLKIDPSALPAKRPGVLAFPTNGFLSQEYGATRFARYGYKGRWHNGVDFAAPIGTPIFAAEKGEVLASANQDLYCPRGAYGKFIAIEHENNLTTLYAHLSLQIVKKGDTVQRSDLIGYVGRTGYATGAHLHFGVYASQTFRIGPSKVNCGPEMPYGGDLNPLDYL